MNYQFKSLLVLSYLMLVVISNIHLLLLKLELKQLKLVLPPMALNTISEVLLRALKQPIAVLMKTFP